MERGKISDFTSALMDVYPSTISRAAIISPKDASALVVLLSGYHGWAVGYGKKMAKGFRPAKDRTLRLMNEVPGIATAVIVILVIVQPF